MVHNNDTNVTGLILFKEIDSPRIVIKTVIGIDNQYIFVVIIKEKHCHNLIDLAPQISVK